MSLVLTLRAGQDFYVGETRFEVMEVDGPNQFYIAEAKQGAPSPEPEDWIEITDREATEILPFVMASSGDYLDTGAIRIALRAPRSILILRGENYRHPPAAPG